MILLFSKVPGLAQVKTRLRIEPLNNDSVTRLAVAFLADTLELISKLDCSSHLVLEPKITFSELEKQIASTISDYKLPDLKDSKLLGQNGLSFGERLEQAIYETYKSNPSHILVIGSDCPLLSEREMNSALELVKDNKSVLGPTPNGGLYLIGLSKEALEQGFSVKELFTEDSALELESFANSLKDKNLPYLLLRTLPDVDVAEDLIGLKTILDSSNASLNKELPTVAPTTRKVLTSLKLSIKRDKEDSRGFKLLTS